MKIYTKSGDKGKTSLIGGKRVSKDDIQIDAYGTIDELNSFLGLLRDYCSIKSDKSFIIDIQKDLFIIGSLLALDYSKNNNLDNIVFSKNKTVLIENKIDEIDSSLPKMTNFIVPGGHVTVSTCHISRSICRRAERKCIKFAKQFELNNNILIYLNRLSDYLFILSRKISLDTNTQEIKWVNK
jgi:cob(I)alamin adenosyltransferase